MRWYSRMSSANRLILELSASTTEDKSSIYIDQEEKGTQY